MTIKKFVQRKITLSWLNFLSFARDMGTKCTNHVYSEALIFFAVSEKQSKSNATMSLVELCRDGDLERVKLALQRGVDVNTKDKNGRTGLMQAVRNNHNSVVELLLNKPNIDLNFKSGRGNCALLQAVHSKNNEGLRLLLEVPTIDANIVNNNGWSAVHVAVDSKNNEALKLLLKVPTIDVNIVNDGGESAVHRAVIHNNIEGLKMLLRARQPSLTALTLNQKDNRYGATPLMRAVRLICSSMGQMELLFADLRVDLDTTDQEGRSLEEVARWNFLVAILFNSQH